MCVYTYKYVWVCVFVCIYMCVYKRVFTRNVRSRPIASEFRDVFHGEREENLQCKSLSESVLTTEIKINCSMSAVSVVWRFARCSSTVTLAILLLTVEYLLIFNFPLCYMRNDTDKTFRYHVRASCARGVPRHHPT